MVINEVAFLFFIFFNEKNERIWLIFDIEKWLWKSELRCFWPSILKRPKVQKYFCDRFHYSLTLLISHYTHCLQKNNFGHTNVIVWLRISHIYLIVGFVTILMQPNQKIQHWSSHLKFHVQSQGLSLMQINIGVRGSIDDRIKVTGR